VRVMFISPAGGAESRGAVFGADAPLDAAGLTAARGASGALDGTWHAVTAPSTRCRQTARAVLGAAPEEAVELADWNVGRWRGRPLAEVAADEPDGVTAWLADPSSAPHGGESLRDLVERTGAWLEAREDPARIAAFADPAVVRATVVHALGLPAPAFWRLDVAPLTATELTGRAGRWNLRTGRPLPG
jgi:broad specificity phosphatase PhoE